MSGAGAGEGVVLRQLDRLFRGGTVAGLRDSQLLDRYLSEGDEAAFEALVNLHGPMVLGLCRRFLHDPHDVDDAFQATFLILVRKAPAIRDRRLLSSWLYGVAYRVAARARSSALKRRSHDGRSLENLPDPDAADPGTASELGPVLDQELKRLPERYRAPLLLCYFGGRTQDQAARELHCPLGTVRSRIARGRDLLKERLERRGLGPQAALFGPGSALAPSALAAPVPAGLVHITVAAAGRFAISKTLQTGAIGASVLALTQGVLTTMNVTKGTWLATMILATAMGTGGVVALAYAASHPRTTQEPPPETRKEPAEPVGLPTGGFDAYKKSIGRQRRRQPAFPPDMKKVEMNFSKTQMSADARLAALEEKVDRLLERFALTVDGKVQESAAPPDETRTEPPEDDIPPFHPQEVPRANPGGTNAALEFSAAGPTANTAVLSPRAISELEFQLETLRDALRFEMDQQRVPARVARISQLRYEFKLAQARLRGLIAEAEEEVDRMRHEAAVREAEFGVEEARSNALASMRPASEHPETRRPAEKAAGKTFFYEVAPWLEEREKRALIQHRLGQLKARELAAAKSHLDRMERRLSQLQQLWKTFQAPVTTKGLR